MIALLGREFVNVQLLCGIAEHSHDASGPPAEVPLVPLSVLAFPPSLWDDLLTVKAQLLSVFVPFLSPTGSAPNTLSVPGCVILPSPFLDP